MNTCAVLLSKCFRRFWNLASSEHYFDALSYCFIVTVGVNFFGFPEKLTPRVVQLRKFYAVLDLRIRAFDNNNDIFKSSFWQRSNIPEKNVSTRLQLIKVFLFEVKSKILNSHTWFMRSTWYSRIFVSRHFANWPGIRTQAHQILVTNATTTTRFFEKYLLFYG